MHKVDVEHMVEPKYESNVKINAIHKKNQPGWNKLETKYVLPVCIKVGISAVVVDNKSLEVLEIPEETLVLITEDNLKKLIVDELRE